MITDALGNIAISTIFFLVTALLSSLSSHYSKPFLRLARGPIKHPNFVLQTVSLAILSFSEIKFSKLKDEIWSVVNFAFGFVLLALIPVTGSFQVYFERPDIVFVFLYLLNRVVFSSPLSVGISLHKTEFDKPLLTSIILIFLFCVFGLRKGGGAHISEPVFHGIIFSSISSFLAFFLLFSYSSLFFMPRSVSRAGVNISMASRFMSKAVWFALLIWIFFGTLSENEIMNFVLYVLFTSLLLTVYEIMNDFFPRISAHISAEIMKRGLLPALLFILLISWVEEKLIW